MLELLKETKSLWEYLRETDKPIYIYGMGKGSEKIIDNLERMNIKINGIFASTDFVRHNLFRGHIITSLDEIISEHGKDFIALLAFGIDYEPMLSYLYGLNEKCEFYAPDVQLFGDYYELFNADFIKQNECSFDEVYNKLADDISKETFLDILNFKISGKVDYLKNIYYDKDKTYNTILNLQSVDNYIDLGAYNGDTISEFSSYTTFKKIVAVEPDLKNFKKLELYCNDNLKATKIELYNLAVWNTACELNFSGGKGGRNSTLEPGGKTIVNADSLDNILKGKNCDFIKCDVEGAEKQAIEGSNYTISKFKPKLMISAYHRNEDLFSIPKQILNINNNYKIYLRKQPYIPAWDIHYIFI